MSRQDREIEDRRRAAWATFIAVHPAAPAIAARRSCEREAASGEAARSRKRQRNYGACEPLFSLGVPASASRSGCKYFSNRFQRATDRV